ncbi:MAG: hypothetical protein ABSH47_27860 [Bryobacteraceae bacterium]|jgi:hypothetical protein
MQMDPNNAVVRLCVEGMECEMTGRVEEVAALFREAWEQSSDDFESFAARHKTAAIDSLRTGDEGGLRGGRRL